MKEGSLKSVIWLFRLPLCVEIAYLCPIFVNGAWVNTGGCSTSQISSSVSGVRAALKVFMA